MGDKHAEPKADLYIAHVREDVSQDKHKKYSFGRSPILVSYWIGISGQYFS